MTFPTLFDTDSTPLSFPHRWCPDDECDTFHPPPPDVSTLDTNGLGTWECPTTGTLYLAEMGEWQEAPRYEDRSYFVAGEWRGAYPGDYDFTDCAECGDWIHYDDAHYDAWGETAYCQQHAPRGDGHSRYASPGTCNKCRSVSVRRYDPLTEAVYCDPCGEAVKAWPIPAVAA